MDDASQQRRWPLGPLVRRIRRTVDTSQRELADLLGVSATAVAQAEGGHRDFPATVLARAAELAGFRLTVVDATGAEVPGMDGDAVRDRSGRHFPAHLDTRHGDIWWWHGSDRHSRLRPRYTFDRDRRERDERRAAYGIPPDHQPPRPGDSLEERARARTDAARTRQEAERLRFLADRRRQGSPPPWTPTCTCPPGCDDLLFADETLPARQRAVPHVADCPCRCDIA